MPTQVLDQIRAETDAALRDQAMRLVDDLQSGIDASVPQLATVANADGGRLMTAAAFLLRANDLLRGARACEDEVEVCALALRSVVELSIVGRYFVAGPHAADEFARRLHDGHALEAKVATQIGTANAPLPPFLQAVAATSTKGPRNLGLLAEELDRLDGWEPGAEGSLVYLYRLLYTYPSNVLVHANALSIKRYTHREGDVLTLRQATAPAVGAPNVLAAACVLYDLAQAVLSALEVSTGALPSAISRQQLKPTS